MLFSFLMVAGLVVTIVALIAVPLLLRSGASNSSQAIAATSVVLLWIAGILSGLMMLISFAAAAWGMDTRPPWLGRLYVCDSRAEFARFSSLEVLRSHTFANAVVARSYQRPRMVFRRSC